MPRLHEPMLNDMVTARFRAFNLRLPPAGAAPTSIGRPNVPTVASPALTQKTAVGSVQRSGTSLPAAALFQPATASAVDVAFQAQQSDDFSAYIAALCRQIVLAHEYWRQRATLVGVQINGVTANGGRISGPMLNEGLNFAGPAQGLSGHASVISKAIGGALANCWQEWQASVRVPGLLWYPAFAAVPGPHAPPRPNVPTPMSALVSSRSLLSPDYLKAAMARRLPQAVPYANELFTSVAEGFSKAVDFWLPMQMVTGVFGRGPIPSFAPPYVPVGSVVGGVTIEAGPNFAS
jgi:hypothetical protein